MTRGSGRGKIVNRGDMAEIAGVALTTIDEWVRRGCPVVTRGGRGRAWKFNSADVIAWREDDIRSQAKGVEISTTDELKRRKLEAEVELVELEVAKERGDVILVAEFERAMTKAFAEVRTRLRGVLPNRVAGRVAALTSETEIKAIFREEIDEALDVLSDESLIAEEDLELEDEELEP